LFDELVVTPLDCTELQNQIFAFGKVVPRWPKQDCLEERLVEPVLSLMWDLRFKRELLVTDHVLLEQVVMKNEELV
jgi:hypothetical protein